MAGEKGASVESFFFQAEDGIRDKLVTGVQTCALPILRRADGSWLLDGGLLIDEVNDRIGANAIPEEDGAYLTLGGFLMARLGRIPSPGEALDRKSVV